MRIMLINISKLILITKKTIKSFGSIDLHLSLSINLNSNAMITSYINN